jgi:hypothetical protein
VDVVGKEAFQSYMRKLFEDAIFGDRWDEEKWKFGYSKWMEDKLIDTLYNTMLVLERYKKLQDVLINQEELVAFLTKVSSIWDIIKNWVEKLQKTATHWQPRHTYGNVATRWLLDQFQREGESVILG